MKIKVLGTHFDVVKWAGGGLYTTSGRMVLNPAGFSLIELLIAIAIMGIVITVSTLSFNSWQTKNKIVSQTREIYSDIVDAKSRSLTQKKVHGILFQPNSYVMKAYSSEAEYKYSATAIANGVEVMRKPLQFGITKNTTNTAFTDDNSALLFDTTGLTSTVPSTSAVGFTIVVNSPNVSPSHNCVVVSVARVNMGKWNETLSKCEFK